ncbi:MAG: hypothetical protein U9Q21_01080, partial [Candidatus Auribacterota bacterium]|nr:hypothetical protein [Candidatus Auribacterota bacterium]
MSIISEALKKAEKGEKLSSLPGGEEPASPKNTENSKITMKSGIAKKSWIFLACFFAVAGLSYGIFKSGIFKDKAFTLPAISKFVKSVKQFAVSAAAKQPDKEQHAAVKLPLPVEEKEEAVKQSLPEVKENVAAGQPFPAEEKAVGEFEADVPLEKETEIPELTLKGIIDGSGRPMVIINDIILSEGDTIEGAKVIKVEGDSVILMHDQKEFTLSL